MENEYTKPLDVGKPNLYREVFPYREFPKVVLDGVVGPIRFSLTALCVETHTSRLKHTVRNKGVYCAVMEVLGEREK